MVSNADSPRAPPQNAGPVTEAQNICSPKHRHVIYQLMRNLKVNNFLYYQKTQK